MMTKTAREFRALPMDYAGLCRLHMPRTIHDRVDYAHVAEVTDAMALWQGDFSADPQDYFDLLCRLLEEYDRALVHWPKAGVQVRLRHLLDESGMSAAELSRLLGGSDCDESLGESAGVRPGMPGATYGRALGSGR